MNVRVQRTGPFMLQLDDLDPLQPLTHPTAGTAARVELPLPRRDDLVAQPVLQPLVLGRELRVQQRREAVRLRRVDRPVQHQVGVG